VKSTRFIKHTLFGLVVRTLEAVKLNEYI